MTSYFTCTLSGNPIEEEPVVSIKTGHIFEKRLILKLISLKFFFKITNYLRHIDAFGTCPITNQELTTKDLIPI